MYGLMVTDQKLLEPIKCTGHFKTPITISDFLCLFITYKDLSNAKLITYHTVYHHTGLLRYHNGELDSVSAVPNFRIMARILTCSDNDTLTQRHLSQSVCALIIKK